MRLDPHRLTLWLALFATGATYLALSPSYRQAPPAARESHWIGLPDSGMDAGAFPLRYLLHFRMMGRSHDDRSLELAVQCGSHGNSVTDRVPERYIARFTESPWKPGWEVVMDVDKEMIAFAIREDQFLPPPPPEGAHAADMITVRPITRVRMPRAKAEPIRRAWIDHALWHAPQKDGFCTDDIPVLLEACIHGHYAVRQRGCVDDRQSAEALRIAIRALLPAPDPAYERPAP